MRKPDVSRVLLAAIIVTLPLILFGFSFSGSFAQKRVSYSEQCLECHEDYEATLAGTRHAFSAEGKGVAVACSDCHRGAENHIEDPSVDNITNPAHLAFKDEAEICSSCHLKPHQQSMMDGNPHSQAELNCSSCHKLHGNEKRGLLKKDEPSLCEDCHTDVLSQFSSPYHHPVPEGVMSCSECHRTLEETKAKMAYAGTNEVCFKCHGEFRGPFPYEHQATVDYSVEQGGCLNCHEAHGSDLPRMLKQTYGDQYNELCSQCHLVPGHKNNSMHGTEWANQPCQSCHADIHGSYLNRLYFPPELEAQGCLNVGCHKR